MTRDLSLPLLLTLLRSIVIINIIKDIHLNLLLDLIRHSTPWLST